MFPVLDPDFRYLAADTYKYPAVPASAIRFQLRQHLFQHIKPQFLRQFLAVQIGAVARHLDLDPGMDDRHRLRVHVARVAVDHQGVPYFSSIPAFNCQVPLLEIVPRFPPPLLGIHLIGRHLQIHDFDMLVTHSRQIMLAVKRSQSGRKLLPRISHDLPLHR